MLLLSVLQMIHVDNTLLKSRMSFWYQMRTIRLQQHPFEEPDAFRGTVQANAGDNALVKGQISPEE
jgi:hypothetical protein